MSVCVCQIGWIWGGGEKLPYFVGDLQLLLVLRPKMANSYLPTTFSLVVQLTSV
jgi:hypothetical protein